MTSRITSTLTSTLIGAGANDSALTVNESGVPESVGMPLVGGSPIVESGSNANGSYTKWADGTMICLLTPVSILATANTAVATSVDFPLAFIAPPHVSFSIVAIGSTYDYLGTLSANGGGSASTLRVTNFTVAQEYVVGGMAIGRWK